MRRFLIQEQREWSGHFLSTMFQEVANSLCLRKRQKCGLWSFLRSVVIDRKYVIDSVSTLRGKMDHTRYIL